MIDTQPAVTPGTKRILVVDDDDAVGLMLVDLLQEENYQVWRARTGAEGERLFEEVNPDLVLLDIMLPDANGLVFCAQLRPRSRRAHSPATPEARRCSGGAGHLDCLGLRAPARPFARRLSRHTHKWGAGRLMAPRSRVSPFNRLGLARGTRCLWAARSPTSAGLPH